MHVPLQLKILYIVHNGTLNRIHIVIYLLNHAYSFMPNILMKKKLKLNNFCLHCIIRITESVHVAVSCS